MSDTDSARPCPSVASYRAGCRCAPCRSHVRHIIILGERRRAERRGRRVAVAS